MSAGGDSISKALQTDFFHFLQIWTFYFNQELYPLNTYLILDYTAENFKLNTDPTATAINIRCWTARQFSSPAAIKIFFFSFKKQKNFMRSEQLRRAVGSYQTYFQPTVLSKRERQLGVTVPCSLSFHVTIFAFYTLSVGYVSQKSGSFSHEISPIILTINKQTIGECLTKLT